MNLVEQRRKFDIDFTGIERLLSHLSRLLDISIDIKSPEGETLFCGHDNAHGIRCCMKEAAPGKCVAESLHLFQQIVTSGKTTLQTNCDDIEIIGIPLQCNKELVGILCACWKAGEGTMVHRAGAFLEEIANRISYEIQMQFETESLTKDLSNRYEELNLIYDVGKELGEIETSEEAIKFIVEHSQIALEPDATLVSIPGSHIREIICSSPSDLPIDLYDKTVIATIDEIIMKRLSSSDLYPAHIVLDGACDNTLPAELLHVSLEILTAPIQLKASLGGILYIINFNTKNSFETGDIRLLTSLAKQISMVITNAELYKNLKEVLLNVIKTLVYSIEAKDSYTRGHSERVSTLALMIAGTMDLSPGEKEALNWAAMLHDIGKIGVPEKILNKAGKLNPEEFSYIKDHPEKGYAILKPIEQLHESLSAIRHHHERYDGTGYPSGLKGQEIPLYARMIAIADTYDAMTSRRSYRKNISHEDAIAEIVSVKGKQLDPELVEIFIALSESTSPFS
jgi:putative nucleotidyltransferase with HDIG domain